MLVTAPYATFIHDFARYHTIEICLYRADIWQVRWYDVIVLLDNADFKPDATLGV